MLKNTIVTTETFLPRVLSTVECKKHGALLGEPCHILPSNVKPIYLLNACDKRARAAGMNGVISQDSISRSSRRSS